MLIQGNIAMNTPHAIDVQRASRLWFLLAIIVFTVFCTTSSASEKAYGDGQSEILKPGLEWRNNIFSLRFRGFTKGNYYLTGETKLENAAPKGQLCVSAIAGGQERDTTYLENRPGFQTVRIPVKVKHDSSSIAIVFDGTPSMTAPGRILLRDIRITPFSITAGDNLIPAWTWKKNSDGLPDGDWILESTGKEAKSVFSLLPNGKISIAPNSKTVVASPVLILPEDKHTKTTIRVNGVGKIRFWLHSSHWKAVSGWSCPQSGSPEIYTTGEENVYQFTFPPSKDNQYYRWRLDVETQNSPIELEMPVLTAVGNEGGKSAAESTEKAKLVYENDFGQPLPEKEIAGVTWQKDPFLGNCVEFTKDGFLRRPLNKKYSLYSGTFSLWVRFDQDFVFDPHPESIWHLGNSTLLGKFIYGRVCFGEFGCQMGVFEQMYKGEWNQLSFTWDNGKYRKMYLNGRLFYLVPWVSGTESFDFISFGRGGGMPSFQGAVAHVRLYDKELSPAEIRKEYAATRPVTPFMLDYSAIAGTKTSFRVGFDNPTGKEQADKRKVTVYAPDRSVVSQHELSAVIPAGTYAIKTFSFTPKTAGDYRVIMKGANEDSFTAVLPIIHNNVLSGRIGSNYVKKELIAEINCAAAQPAGRYADDGSCHVSSLNGVLFRETSRKEPSSGFTYRVTLKNPGKPHWIEFDYPDDRTRTFFCGISQVVKDYFHDPFLDSCGVITGDNFPVSGTIQTKGFYFMTARNRPEIGVVFGSHYNPNGESGPAVSKIRVYEVTAPLPVNPINPNGRKIMNWNEDPTMFAYTWFNQYQWNKETTNYDFWREKFDVMVEYSRYIGWSKWSTLFYDYGGNTGAGDLRLQDSLCSGGLFQPGFLSMLEKTAEREQIPFYLSINHLAAWGKENIPFAISCEIGEEHLSQDFAQAEKRGVDAPELFSADNALVEIRHRALNPIHPRTREAMRKIFRACSERYGNSPMFQGIDYQSVEPLHFTDPKYGYGDYTIGLYRKETGSALPRFSGSDRFGKRYKWLKDNEWEPWLDWRCRKIVELAESLVKELNGKKLIFRVTIEQLLPSNPSKPSLIRKTLEQGRIPDLIRAYREQGVDLQALARIPNVIVMPDIRPNHSRVFGDKADERPLNFSEELFSMWKIPGIHDLQITQHNNLEMWQGGGFIPTSKGTESRSLRVFATSLPNNRFALENFAWCVAMSDPMEINHGWWGNPETGAYEEFRRFYRAFSEIPQRPFAAVPGTNDPVFVRQSGDLLYAVNLCAWSAEVGVYGKEKFALTDVVSGNSEGNPGALKLRGYELRVFRQDRTTPIIRTVQTPPKELCEIVEQRLKLVPPDNPAALRALKFRREGKLAAAYFALQLKTITPLFLKPLLETTGHFLPDGTTLELNVRNTSLLPVKCVFSLRDIPDAWRFVESEKKVVVPPQTTIQTTFTLAKGKAIPGACYQVRLSCMTDGVEAFQNIRCQPVIAGFLAGISAQNYRIPESFKRYSLFCESPFKESFPRAANFAANYSVGWNQNGLALTIRVEDRDFLPPPTDKIFWENDSIVVYFGRKSNAREGVKEYSQGDIAYRIAQVQGKAVVLAGEALGKTDQVKAKITRKNGWTEYALFFPSAVLSELKMRAGSYCGFSLEAINRDISERRVVFTPHPEHPNLNPYVWSDLILTSQTEK